METIDKLLSKNEIEDFLSVRLAKAKHEQSVILEQCLRLIRDPSGDRLSKYRSADALKDVVWERLHTGNWRKVEHLWREIFAAVTIIKIKILCGMFEAADDKPALIADLVKLCDVGLLMGAPVMDNVCGKMATELSAIHRKLREGPGKDAKEEGKADEPEQKKLKVDVLPPGLGDSLAELDRVEGLSAEDFLERYKLHSRPVVITGMMTHWPASSRWSVDYIRRKAGLRMVPVEIGSRYTDSDWTQKLMTVNEFVEGYLESKDHDEGSANRPLGYLAQHQFLDQVEELKDDIEIPEYCFTGDEEEVDINSWFGPSGTVSPLHTDPKHNILCQVFGRKLVIMYPSEQSKFLYPYEDELLFNTARVDIDNGVDLEKFPKFSEALGFRCVLEKGDMLYIPPKCWHYVKSLAPSFSLSFWFQ